MYLYSVMVNIKQEAENEWLEWMHDKHISDILNTGYFNGCKMYKTILPSGVPDETSYVVQYECESLKDYEEYIYTEAKRLQAKHNEKFAGKFTAARSVLVLVENPK